MKTVPTLVASTAGVAVSALGYAFARPDDQQEPRNSTRRPPTDRRSVSAPLLDMTATATCTVQAVDTYAEPISFPLSSPTSFSFTAQQSLRSAVSRDRVSGHGRRSLDFKSMTSFKRDSLSRDSEGMGSQSGKERLGDELSDPSATASSTSQSTWLKRLSTFSSIDSSLPPSPRPASAAFSQSNGSVAFSNAGSTAAMFPTHTPPPIPPNKLVKRSASVRSAKSSPLLSSGSRLPLPSLKRPATSHQRDATMQERRNRSSTYNSLSSPQQERTDVRWKSFFAPKIAASDERPTWRRHSTSIPNPIKRVYPDRRYTPVLMSAREHITVTGVEIEGEDTGLSAVDVQDLTPQQPLLKRNASTSLKVARRFFSSPLPPKSSITPSSTNANVTRRDSETRKSNESRIRRPEMDPIRLTKRSVSTIEPKETSPRRSFSPSDLLPREPKKWKRPPANRPPEKKNPRRGPRSVSGPQAPMGNRQSNPSGDIEPPTKRRETVGVIESRSRVAATVRSSPSISNRLQPSAKSSPAIGPTFSFHKPFNLQRQPSETFTPPPPQQQQDTRNPTTSSTSTSSNQRPSRRSTNVSASTFTGSEGQLRDDDGFDSPVEGAYDSVRTRATSASSGMRGPSIENIFDESRRVKHEDAPNGFERYDQRNSPFARSDVPESLRHSVIEEEDSVSTPVRVGNNGSVKMSSIFRFGSSPPQTVISSSPPELSFPARPMVASQSHKVAGEEEEDAGDDDSEWGFDQGQEDGENTAALPMKSRFPHLDLESDKLSPYSRHGSSSLSGTPQKGGINTQANDKEARSSIFDWSEQQPLDKSPGNGSPPRPKTVHGKKDAENRGSRSVGRRAPSGVHARSQSVPVAPEADGKRNQVVTNKFGTWGVGSKGVTEDWNEDFDFDEPPIPPMPQLPLQIPDEQIEKRLDSGLGMFVPKSIREQQHNVLANIGLLRDWGLLIEELKGLKMRAVNLHIHSRPEVWSEVDAMIDLADQESNDITLAPRDSPPSSPTIDYAAFDDPVPAMPPLPSPLRSKNAVATSAIESASPSPVKKETEMVNASPRRPRKDSEAVAKSVIEALQKRRNISDPTGATTSEDSGRKVPFDTTTLRRLVPYVQDLRDKVKKTLREEEGLHVSPPSQRPAPAEDPSFSRIFLDPPESPSANRRNRRSVAATEHARSDERGSRSPPEDLTARLKLMTVV